MKTVKILNSSCIISLPAEFREKFGLEPGDAIDMLITDEGLLIRKHANRKYCKVCGSEGRVIEQNGLCLCEYCIRKFVEKYKLAKEAGK